MAEQTFRSPGFFENEIDLAAKDVAPQGVPAGIIGTAEKGPAFVPVTMGGWPDFMTKFGSLSPDRFGPYAVREWFKNKTSLTYMRVLGAGSNQSTNDFSNTKNFGIVKNAGFIVSGTAMTYPAGTGHYAGEGCVQFITARHTLPNTDGGEMFGFPVFTDNDSFAEQVSDKVNLVRGMLFTTTGSRFEVIPNASVGASAVGVIDLDESGGHVSDDDVFTILVPAAAGGDVVGGAGTIRIDFHATLQAAADDQINVHVQANATATAAMVVKAINGVADVDDIQYPAGGRGQAGVKGVTASVNAVDATLIDLTANGGTAVTTAPNTWGVASNDIALASTQGGMVIAAALGAGLKMTGGRNGQYTFAAAGKKAWTTPTDFVNGSQSKYKNAQSYFKLVLSTSAGEVFGKDEGHAGLKIFTASLEPTDPFYVGKILNTDPTKFYHERHLLYLDLPVESEIAKVDTSAGSIALLSGSLQRPVDLNPKDKAGNNAPFLGLFGRFDTRYSTPKTTSIISQPFGSREWDLFHFETISDGEWGNSKFKISIANIKASTDPANPYGTFEVQLRGFTDTDRATQILERFPNCTLDPDDERFVARQVGDMRARWNFDAESESERRLVVRGKYPNRSHRFRIVMNQVIEDGVVPSTALPFGFRGLEVLRTSDSLTDRIDTILTFNDGAHAGVRAGGVNQPRIDAAGLDAHTVHRSAIIPPLPMRFKVTKGAVENIGAGAGSGAGMPPLTPGVKGDENPIGIGNRSSRFVGRPGKNERVDPRLYWGVKTSRLPISSSLPAGETHDAILKSNDSKDPNKIVEAYTKMHGIAKLGTLVTGSAADEFNDNKFTLSRVALENSIAGEYEISKAIQNRLEKIVSGTSRQHMLQAVYVRNKHPESSDYTVDDRFKTGRITMATLVHSSAILFNRFTEYNKFTTVFAGGFDGTNSLSRDGYYMTDRASSSDLGGHGLDVANGDCYQGLSTLVAGTGTTNSVVKSYETAVSIMTDPTTVRINLLAIPGMRDSNIVDNALEKVRDYGFGMYVMDIRNYDQDTTRLFDDHVKKPDVRVTSEQFDGEAIDNNYAAVYFPDVLLRDDENNKPVRVPASVAAISALGFNDRVGFPWFAPAGFNRGSLASVENVHTRLSASDRDELYDVRVNPIAVFPTGKYVIFGQKTLQQAKSALDRVNVRRLLLEVKRRISSTARKLLFEANDAQTRARFIGEVTPQLAIIQAQAGIEKFSVVCDGSNNTTADEEENRMNGRIVIVPTLAVEFISMDFIVTSAGVSFE
jgi:hypothetical protein